MHLYIFPKQKSAKGNGFISLQKGHKISLNLLQQYPHLIVFPITLIFKSKIFNFLQKTQLTKLLAFKHFPKPHFIYPNLNFFCNLFIFWQ